MFQDFPRLKRSGFGTLSGGRVRWQPAADVYRTPSGWLLKIELAGVAKEEIQVRASGRKVVVAGQRRDSCCDDEFRECQSLEITYCQFERGFELPRDLAAATIQTEYRDGMLLVRVTVEGEAT